MEICPPDPPKRTPRPSIIEAKNKIQLGHDACCNCCCCIPQSTCYKYVQPEVPKSFAPIRYYWKSDVPMDKNTTYRLSYWENPSATIEPIYPKDNLTMCGDTVMSDETTHKASYLGNWCVKPDPPITPCDKQWLGKGPMQDITTHKRDYSWKCMKHAEPLKAQNNLYTPCAALSDDTTYRLSYYNSPCLLPVPSYAPIRKYVKSDVPMDGCTTYRLSYWPNEIPVKEEYPWSQKGEYHCPVIPMDGCTTYKLSYWPQCEKPREAFVQPDTENLLNAGCCFDDNTTYRLSYFECGGDKPQDPIRQPGNMIFSPCPLSHDTVNRLSFLGNWCVKPEAPIVPCDRQMLGSGPMQDITTQKHDYNWKHIAPPTVCRPENNFIFSPSPLECCTTHKLSYMPSDHESLLPIKSYAPIRKYQPSDVPMESETTMGLSYQPVETWDRIDKPWAAAVPYHPPVNPMEDNTTYNMSYIPPGTLVPLPTCSASCAPANTCEVLQSCPVS